MRLILLTVLISISLGAQNLPDAAALIKRQEASNQAHQSIQYVTEVEIELVRNGRLQRTTGDVWMAYQNPGKVRLESKLQGTTVTIVSNGQTTWAYNSMSHQYTRQEAAPGTAGVMELLGGVQNVPDVLKNSTTMRTLREEKLRVDGESRDCWLVEARIGKVDSPGGQGARLAGGVVEYWIDQKSEVALKVHTSLKMIVPGQAEPVEMRQTMTRRDVRIDEPIPESRFTFTPPPDATEVPELFGVGLPKTDLTGQPAAGFEVTALDGRTYSLAGFRGRPVLLEFWTSWCGPCRTAVPVLDLLYQEFKGQGLMILGINGGEDRQTVETFLKNHPVPYPSIPGGDAEILASYRVSAYPTFVMVGRDGHIVAYQMGFGGEARLRAMLRKAGLGTKK